MEISIWLERFEKAWLNKDLRAVINLFSNDVVYFETPFIQLKSSEEILEEWQEVLKTENIEFEYEIFVENQRKGVVNWSLAYDIEEKSVSLKGVYLIKLNEEGLCDYFFQTCESNNWDQGLL